MTFPQRCIKRLVTFLISGLVAVAVAAPSTARADVGAFYQPIAGSGSTWSANALQAWMANVWANFQWKITYSESGSTVGRNDFKQGTADFGVSEIPYAISNSNEGDNRPVRGFAYMPIVAGGTAFMYNLKIGGQRVTNLRLSGENLAKIFTNQIKVWNDPAIAKDNPMLALPATPIVPVVRSDGSGTSAQFTTWMRQVHPDIWNAYCDKVGRGRMADGVCGITSNYPTLNGSGFVARKGADGVAGYVSQNHAEGAITFVEYSYALNARFPVVKVLNAAGYYIEPTAGNVAVALLQAQINQNKKSVDYLTQNLSRVYTDRDPRTYPLSSYSYIILPTSLEGNFTNEKGKTLADFGAYFLCEGQTSAEKLGYSPLPINLVQAGQEQIKKIPGGDPKIKTTAQCHNPTLSPDGTNALAKKQKMPPACDKVGTTQCMTGTAGSKNVATKVSKGTSSETSRGGNTASRSATRQQQGSAQQGATQQQANTRTGSNAQTSADQPGAATGQNGAPGEAVAPGGAAVDPNVAGGAGEVLADPGAGGGAGNDQVAAPNAIVAATPQMIDMAGGNPAVAWGVGATGAALVSAALLPPLVARRRRTLGEEDAR